MHHYHDLITVFNTCFLAEYNTVLIKGDGEPIYLPANQEHPQHRIYFAYGYFSSALHECAHWLIAGEARRQLDDYGYWYTPDGRNEAQQQLFQRVEAKPQALEWILSVACHYPFRISIDNLDGQAGDSLGFKQSVYDQVKRYCLNGLPKRAQQFYSALSLFYGNPNPLTLDQFSLPVLIETSP